MRNNRYVHYVARFGDMYLSGVVDVAPQTTPPDVHEGIQAYVCDKWKLSRLHMDDIIVEKMECIE